MPYSIFELFKVGIGPSSSHTVGPMVAARRFVDKLMAEGDLKSVCRIEVRLYGSLAFTGVGHGSDDAVLLGLIGEDPNGIPNNLVPYVSQVAVGKLKQLSIFGNDYPTHDGTGVRDYIHVVDLVKGHTKALQALESDSFEAGDCKAYNLGAGRGYSVLEIIQAFETITHKKINYTFAARRSGDVAENYANPALALKDLGWQTERNLHDMVTDTWHWQTINPHGYNE